MAIATDDDQFSRSVAALGGVDVWYTGDDQRAYVYATDVEITNVDQVCSVVKLQGLSNKNIWQR